MASGMVRGLLPVLGLAMLAGCRGGDGGRGGDRKDVNVETPFGGLSVDTRAKNVPAAVGLSVYPGATAKTDGSSGRGAADVNLSFGSFHLGVKAAEYTTPDPPDRVLRFYRGELRRYGTVIECRGDRAVGAPAETEAGLGCRDREHSETGDGDGGLELKAGSPTHQHVVSVKPDGTGSAFAILLLDLPGKEDGGE